MAGASCIGVKGEIFLDWRGTYLRRIFLASFDAAFAPLSMSLDTARSACSCASIPKELACRPPSCDIGARTRVLCVARAQACQRVLLSSFSYAVMNP